MSAVDGLGGRLLGQPRTEMPDIRIYPAAVVTIVEGGDGIGDATHHMEIRLPFLNMELRLPYNTTALRKLGRDALRAAGVPQAQTDETTEV